MRIRENFRWLTKCNISYRILAAQVIQYLPWQKPMKEVAMFDFEKMSLDELMNQDDAVLEAMAKVDRGLFDSPEGRDEDLDALYDN